MKVLGLFSGIGGFELGLERAGFEIAAMCEIHPWSRKVLRKHWPDVPIYKNVKKLSAVRLQKDGITPDVLSGGFPCQDISAAGKGAGITGPRSSLWKDYARLISEIRPKYAIVENVSALFIRGFSTVLGDLAENGYDAEWHCIPASALGAPHQRSRLWIIAYPSCMLRTSGELHTGSHTQSTRTPILKPKDFYANIRAQNWWSNKPNLGRVAYGVPQKLDRHRGLGNAVVPQIPEIIGRAILKYEKLKQG